MARGTRTAGATATLGGPSSPSRRPATEHDAILSDAVGAALLLVLERLAPAERLPFVLLDLFAMPVDDVARVLGRTPTATGQLAGRARRQVQSPDRTLDAERVVQGRVVEAFLTASAAGDREELVWLLHPDAVLHADTAAVSAGSTGVVHGAAGSRRRSRAGSGRPDRCCSTASRQRPGGSAAGPGWCSASPSSTAGSPRSSCSPTPTCSPSWTSRAGSEPA